MGGYFAAVSKRDCVADVFFGADYHSHLGTKRGGMAAWSREEGLQREIHSIESSPFRTKFENILSRMKGTAALGCISDADPMPILIRSGLGVYAIMTVGVIRNAEALGEKYLRDGGHFEAMSSGRVNAATLVAALINTGDDLASGIRLAQREIEGTAAIVLLLEDGTLIAARDLAGRLPMHICRNHEGFCVTLESFAGGKLGYAPYRELGPGEVVKISAESVETLVPPEKEMKICAFLWTYYGYPGSEYEGVSVEVSRGRNGAVMAKNEGDAIPEVDRVAGVPDSGTAHAIGYANKSGLPFGRPFIKYTPTWPRSFMPQSAALSQTVARMKLIPVRELIEGKSLLFVDDSIVRGTQLRETVEFLYESGAKQVHIRSACPPVMFGCHHLNFTRATKDTELIARRTVSRLEGAQGERHIQEYSDGSTQRGCALRQAICEELGINSLEYQTLEGLLEAIGLPADKVCTYCWTGKE